MSYQNLLEMTAHTVSLRQDRMALSNPAPDGQYRTWTYGQLWQDIRKVAGRLEALGVEKGDRVGLISESRSWWLISDLAIMSLGAITVPVFPNLGAAQVFEVFNHAQVRGVLAQDKSQVEKIMSLEGAWTQPLDFVGMYDSGKGDLANLQMEPTHWTFCRFFDWLDAPALLSEEEWTARWAGLRRTDLATFVYTSGTTGKPKGVELTHGNLLANVEGIERLIPIDYHDIGLSYLPLSHIFERTASQFVLLNAGSALAYSEGMDKIVSEFGRIAPTVFTTVPRLLEKVHEGVLHKIQHSSALQQRLFHRAIAAGIRGRVEKKSSPLLWLYDAVVLKKIRQLFGGRLRLIVVGGAPLPPYIFEFLTALGLCVVEGYGLTETSPVIAVNPVTDSRKGTVGKVLHNVQVKIAEDGEILVRGESISQGYYKNPEATQAAYDADGWFRTGDIGELTVDGYLKVTDRKKNLLVLSTGKNVAPAPIESAILSSSLVEQVLVIGNGRKYVSAIIVPDSQTVERVRHRLHAHGSLSGEASGEVSGKILGETSGEGRGETERVAERVVAARVAEKVEEGVAEEEEKNPVAAQTIEPHLVEESRASQSTEAELHELLMDAVKKYTAMFAEFEQPKQIIVAREPFTVENGLLTPTLKVRSNRVMETYRKEIDELYHLQAKSVEQKTVDSDEAQMA